MYGEDKIIEQASKQASKQDKDCIRLGNVNGKSGGSFAGQVYDKDYIAPTLTDMQGGGRQPHILEVENMTKEYGTTLTALENGIYRIEECEEYETHYSFKYLVDGEVWQIRIRKLTPRECGRLQDVSDSDIDKMEKVESNSQLYKAFGNSITVNCLTAIFGQMLEGKEDVYKGVK